MASAIEHFLTEFHLNPALDVAPLARPQPVERETEREIVDIAALIRSAEERGREDGRAEARRGFEAELAAERASSEERIAHERAQWTEEVASQLAGQFEEAFRALDTKVADSVARILTPFLTQVLRDQAVSDLAATLEVLFSDRSTATVRITGPEDLLSRLSHRLGSHNAAVDYAAGDHAEVRVVMNDTLIETQLSAWTARLANAVRSS